MAPILYTVDTSPPGNAVRALADIIGLQTELKHVNFLKMEHKSPEYLKINPLGTIPTLQDGDFITSDSHAIMTYLLLKYGELKRESLYPSDLRMRTLIDQGMYFDTGVYFIKLKEVALPSVFGDYTETPEKLKEEIDNCYSVLEAFLQNRKYTAADHLTLSDLSLGATTSSMQPLHKLDAKKFPRTSDWFSRLEQESYFKTIVTPGSELMGKAVYDFWERNKQNKLKTSIITQTVY